MESFTLKPTPEQEERIRVRFGETRVWWVEFDPALTQVFCDAAHVAAVIEADYGIAWAGVQTFHYPRRIPTDRPDVTLIKFGAPILKMAVPHERMKGWMEVVRANRAHGRYREAGVHPERWYEF